MFAIVDFQLTVLALNVPQKLVKLWHEATFADFLALQQQLASQQN